MKLGVVADTHSLPLPQQMLNEFKDVEFIIHAGDFCSLADLKQLSAIKPVKAVQGNMDGSDIRKKFPEKQLIKWKGFVIGVYHGSGGGQDVLKSVQQKFKDDDINVAIFGHSHEACNQEIGGVLYFNPGSPNDRVRAKFCSYGILEVQQNKLVGSIIKVK